GVSCRVSRRPPWSPASVRRPSQRPSRRCRKIGLPLDGRLGSAILIGLLADDRCAVSRFFFFFQAEDGIRDYKVTGVQTCALPILTEFTGGRAEIALDDSAATVGEALNQLWNQYIGLRDRVLTEQGEVRPHVNIF